MKLPGAQWYWHCTSAVPEKMLVTSLTCSCATSIEPLPPLPVSQDLVAVLAQPTSSGAAILEQCGPWDITVMFCFIVPVLHLNG